MLAIAPVAVAGQLLAQDCPGSLLHPPTVHLSVSIDVCDYLAVLAEPRHPRDCSARRLSVASDPTSRVHVLSQLLADSLRSVFQDHFGFLRWSTDTVQRRWSVTVRLWQRPQDQDPLIDLELRDGAAVVATADALFFESPDLFEELATEQQGQTSASLGLTRTRWAKTVAALLARNDGVDRTKWLKTALRRVPLTTSPLDTMSSGSLAFARVAIRDGDIRAEPESRPSFEWKITQIRTVLPEAPLDTARDEGAFLLGECHEIRKGYRCKMLGLKYGPESYATPAEAADFLRRSPALIPPMALYVIEYRPARQACPLRGVNPQ